MRDWLTILTRMHWIWHWYHRFPFATPLPWKRCHCGALADIRVVWASRARRRWRIHQDWNWCSPCKYAAHDTCECGQPEEKTDA